MSLLIAILCATTAQFVAAFIAGGPLGATPGGVRGSRDITKRARAGWLPVPHGGTDLTPELAPALVSVDAFVDRLAELPLAAWLDVGRSLMDDRSGRPDRTSAFANLTTAIHDRELHIASWYVRDAVETCACLANSGAHTWSSRDRRAFDAARTAANDGALALLARESLSPESFRVLLAPCLGLVGVRMAPQCP